MNTYWWKDIPNFGDRLAPLILKRFADIDSVWTPLAEAEIITVGSILEHVTDDWSGIIVGSGRLLERSTLHLASADVRGVRGPLSLRGQPYREVVIGDPGLLADELVYVSTRDIDLGVVPHWSDTRLANDYRFQGSWSRLVISAWQDPFDVVAAIGRCKKIVTSSLHGLILADAFGIPRRFEPCSRMGYDDTEGGLFKFRDYGASVNVPFRIGEVQVADRNLIDDRKNELYDMYRSLKGR